ncbi:hypothetical protein [Leuconostoc miyukkimchii]|uniref:hypothetical protein n=1 Tax=Leuconostoc miyukkimchii TaxID=910540 RepID=UPI001C7D3906|nr:hypothetical protein [Leuconostoc miyukkimchii]
MNKIDTKSKIFQLRLTIAIIAIILLIVSFIYPDNIYFRLTMNVLLIISLSSSAFESFQNKKWFSFSAFLLVILLTILTIAQSLYFQLYIY